MSATKLYTVAEAAKLAGIGETAIRNRIRRGRLKCVEQTRNGRTRYLIPQHALMAAGLIGNPPPTRSEKNAQRLVKYLSTRAGVPLTTTELAFRSHLPRQATEAAMGVLLALGRVRKNYEPPRIGTGRPRVVWRWVV